MARPKLVVFSGAGISAESGISTFRDSGGLWENYKIEEVATPDAFIKNPGLVLDFYNMRRRQVLEAEPNAAHKALVSLEKHFDVQIITQNIDDLHERAGSRNVLHLHGDIRKARSVDDPTHIYDITGWELKLGDKGEDGAQLRPHIVWFGEAVPAMETAYAMAEKADYFVVVGTSLVVYPAADVISYVPEKTQKFYIDPNPNTVVDRFGFKIIREKASTGLEKLEKLLIGI